MKTSVNVSVAGRPLTLSNLEKVFYPQTGFTKAQTIHYYTRVAPALLPHLRNRPLTLKRYPDGASGAFFYEKNCPEYRPDWMRTAPVWSAGGQRTVNYCVVNDLPSLIWAANLAVLELHTSLSLAKDIDRPTMLVFDLDPGPPANALDCARVALLVRKKLLQMQVEAFAKTSGAKGIQVCVPLNTATDYAQTKNCSHDLAKLLEKEAPDQIVSNMRKELRGGKVLVDWSQNDAHKTTVCVYSLRAAERPTVSTPLTWPEIRAALRKNDPNLLSFTSEQALERIDKHGDLFAPLLKLRQRLAHAVV